MTRHLLTDCRHFDGCENGHGDCLFPESQWKRDIPRPKGTYGYDCTAEKCPHYSARADYGGGRCRCCGRG